MLHDETRKSSQVIHTAKLIECEKFQPPPQFQVFTLECRNLAASFKQSCCGDNAYRKRFFFRFRFTCVFVYCCLCDKTQPLNVNFTWSYLVRQNGTQFLNVADRYVFNMCGKLGELNCLRFNYFYDKSVTKADITFCMSTCTYYTLNTSMSSTVAPTLLCKQQQV